MTKRLLLVTLLLSAFFNLSPLRACQPENRSNFVYDLEDGRHVFVMKYYENETFEYPVSGVYRKGPGKELIWEYHGYIGYFDLLESISSIGQYLIETKFHLLDETFSPDFPLDQYVVVSIYDRGRLIGEFTMDVFIDRESLHEAITRYESSEYRFRCDSWQWGYLEYDKLNNQIRIRTAAKRTVVIDVPTAQILYIDEY